MRDKGLEAALAAVVLEGDLGSSTLRQTLTEYYSTLPSFLGLSVERRVELAIERLGRAAQAALQR